MIAAQEWQVTLTLQCDGSGCSQQLVVSGEDIRTALDAAERAGWKVRARIGRDYCTACPVPVDSGRGTTITQDRDGKVVVRP